MDWFLYDKDLRHERVNSSNYIIFYVRKRNQDPQKALSWIFIKFFILDVCVEPSFVSEIS